MLDELAALVAQRPELRAGGRAGDRGAGRGRGVRTPRWRAGAYRHGVDVAAWVLDPDGAPPVDVPARRGGRVPAHPARAGAAVAGAVRGRSARCRAAGRSRAGRALAGAAARRCWSPRRRAGVIDDALLAAAPASARRSQGLRMSDGGRAGARRWRRSTASRAGSGWSRCSASVDGRARQHARRAVVVAGPPAALDALHARLAAQAQREAAERRDGRARRRAAALRLDAAAGRRAVPLAGAGRAAGRASEASAGPRGPTGRRCSGEDGGAARRAVRRAGALGRVAARIVALGADWVLDLGPGTAVARLTAENLRGTGVRTLALASPEGRRVLTSPGAAPAGRDVDVRDAGAAGRRAARRAAPPRHALHAGDRPPAGDPRGDDADDRRRADRRRRRERRLHGRAGRRRAAGPARRSSCASPSSRSCSSPGARSSSTRCCSTGTCGSCTSARDALLFGARRAGAPFARADGLGRHPGRRRGDRAARPARRRRACALNAFKPGTVEQVRRLLAIADAAPHHTIAAHTRGRRGGRAPLVGGPRGAAARDLPRAAPAAERARLRGRRDRHARSAPPSCCAGPGRCAHGELAMPVDARAGRDRRDGLPGGRGLAAGQGARWSRPAARAAGCRGAASRAASRRRASNLNADIHLLDNAASRAGHLLESVAGDAAAVAARRDEIVEALALTAKPYFGDLDAMTYLRRCSSASPSAARPGAAGATTTAPGATRAGARARWRLYRRFAARLAVAESGRSGGSSTSTIPRPRCDVRRGLPVRGDDAAAPRRRAVLPRGLRPARQAGAVRAGARRRGAALVHGGRAVAGPGRPARRRRGVRHPRPRGGRRDHARRRAGGRAARALRGGARSRACRRASPSATGSPTRARRRTAGGRVRGAARSRRCAPRSAWSARTGARARTRCGGWSRPGDAITERDGTVVIRPSARGRGRDARAPTARRARTVDTGDVAARPALPAAARVGQDRDRPGPTGSDSRSSPRCASAAAARPARAFARSTATPRAPPSRRRAADGAARRRRPVRGCASRGAARPDCRARTGPRPARRTRASRSTSR